MSNKAVFEKEFGSLQEAWGVDEGHRYYTEANWQNSLADLRNTLDRIDSDVRQEFFDDCFPKDDTVLGGRAMTPYARQLVCARYCMGWIGNVVQGDHLEPEQAQALGLVYAAYWHLGEDFLLGNIVENLLRRVGDPQHKAPPMEASAPNSPTALGMDIWKEIWKTWRENYFAHSGIGRAFATAAPQKPPFRNDFLVKVKQLLQPAVKASPKKKTPMKNPAPKAVPPKKTLGKRKPLVKKPVAGKGPKKSTAKKAR